MSLTDFNMKLELRHIVAGLTAAFAVGLNWVAFTQSAAQTSNRAGLVVRYDDGSAQTACVSFTEDAITGYDLLRRSNIPVIADVSSNMGAFVCKIGNAGCNFPQEDCGCKFNTEQKYWSYWLFQNGVWQYANVGAGSASVSNGSVQGWVWGTGSANTEGGTKPPVLTLEQICSASAATPSLTPTATATPLPTATPTHTPQPPTPTATYTPVPLANVAGGGQAIAGITPQPSATNAALISIAPTLRPTPNAQAQAVVAQVVIATSTTLPTPTPVPTVLPPSPTPMVASATPALAAPTATPTAEPLPTATTSRTPTVLPTEPPAPTLPPTPSVTLTPPQAPSPQPTTTPPPPNSNSNFLGYVVFGLMALGLAGGLVLLRARK